MNKYAQLYFSSLVQKVAENKYVDPSAPSGLQNAIDGFQNFVGDATTGVSNFFKGVGDYSNRLDSAMSGKPYEEDLFNEGNKQREMQAQYRQKLQSQKAQARPAVPAPQPAVPPPTVPAPQPTAAGTASSLGLQNASLLSPQPSAIASPTALGGQTTPGINAPSMTLTGAPGPQPSVPAQPAGPDDSFLKSTMGSYNPNSRLDKAKADYIRSVYKPGMKSTDLYRDKKYMAIK
jgi:hypothetical protein